MRQVGRRLKDGRLELVQVPEPVVRPGTAAVRIEASVISAGTEGATLEVARKGLVAKARARPEQARQVVDRARSEGVRSTFALVRQRLEELGPLGYSAAGTVREVGEGARGISPGDRVAVAGGEIANHAELDIVPSLLCARVPDEVATEDAAFATLGAIALHGFRRSDAEVGATVAVIGLGLVGQLAVRIARAAGCRVLGIDLKPELCELAASAGAETAPRDQIAPGSRWEGSADAVLVCAASSSSDPVELAALLARDRAAVVAVGDVALEAPRQAFYEKELDLRLSRSYGPGRYDPDYELHGIDYPVGYVRWTEQRNLEAFLGLVAEEKVRPSELVTHSFGFGEAERAFEALSSAEATVGVLLRYDDAPEPSEAPTALAPTRRPRTAKPRLGVIGAGSFATSTLIPGLVAAGCDPVAIASASGLSAESARRQFEFESALSDPAELLARDDLDLIAIATQHDTHAELAAQALETGRTVYVEKPLALDWEGLALVRDRLAASGAPLIVGFNRRHSPAAAGLRELGHPRLTTYRVNAGPLPAGHWANDLARGGGRLKGEGCHFVDFICHQAASDPVSIEAAGFASRSDLPLAATDNFQLRIRFADGSAGTVSYAADAPTAAGKERIEVSAPGAFAVADDFRGTRIWRGQKQSRRGGRRQDKGFAAQFDLVRGVAAGEKEPPTTDGFFVSTIATLAAARSLETARAEAVIEPDSEPREVPTAPAAAT